MGINTDSSDTPSTEPRRWRPVDWLIIAAGATLCGSFLNDSTVMGMVIAAVLCFTIAVASVIAALITSGMKLGFFRMLAAVLIFAVSGSGLLQDGAGLVFWPQYKEYRECLNLALTDVTRQECVVSLQNDLQRRVEELSAS